jgi:hypothetical protein
LPSEYSSTSRHWHLAPSASLFKCFPSIFVPVCLCYLSPCGLTQLLLPLLPPRISVCPAHILKFFSVGICVLFWESGWQYG